MGLINECIIAASLENIFPLQARYRSLRMDRFHIQLRSINKTALQRGASHLEG